MLIDVLLFIASMAGAYLVRFHGYLGDRIPVDFYFRISILAIPIYLFIHNYYQLYESYRTKRLMLEISRVIKSNTIGILFIFILSFLIKEVNVSRMVISLFGLFNTALMISSRVALRKIMRSIRRKGYNLKHLLIVGQSELARDFCKRILSNKNLGYSVEGFLGNKKNDYDWNISNSTIAYRGKFNDLEQILSNELIDEVVAALEYDQYEHLSGIIASCEKSGTKVSVVPFYTKYLPARPYIDEVEGLPVINVRRIPLDNLLNNCTKRLFDFFAAFTLVVLLSPLLLVTAVGVKATSPGPILYKQIRVGLNKKNFTMYKFRSMKVSTDGTDRTAWSTKNDPRKTKFGSFIRKYSIDELPQLFNVMEGTMSLVGPRPELPFHVGNFREEIPLYMVKHQVRPGITGWAQVNGLRGDTSIAGRIEHDIFYIENWSFLLDIKILIMTLFKGVVNQSE